VVPRVVVGAVERDAVFGDAERARGALARRDDRAKVGGRFGVLFRVRDANDCARVRRRASVAREGGTGGESVGRARRGRTARALERSIGRIRSSAEEEEEEEDGTTTTTTRDGRTRVRALVLRYRRDVRPLRAVAVGDVRVLLGLGGRHRAATTDDDARDRTSLQSYARARMRAIPYKNSSSVS
jgi:hypothetical protein